MHNIVKRFALVRIGVIGDAMLDRFLFGAVQRLSPEAPVPVVSIEREVVVAGGAANVASNIAALGGRVDLVSVVGTDAGGGELVRSVKKQGISTQYIMVHSGHITSQKTRVIGGGQHIVRMDRERVRSADTATERRILKMIERGMRHWDVVIVSDYAKGLITSAVGRGIVSLARTQKKKVIVDTKPKNALYLKGAFLFTPNVHEASAMAGTDDVAAAGRLLQKKLQANILITQGIHGMTLFDAKKKVHIPAQAHTVFDVVGAGDTVVAVCALVLAVGAGSEVAARIANIAAGLVVSKEGTATLSPHELMGALY